MHDRDLTKSEESVEKALEQFLWRYKLSDKLTVKEVRQWVWESDTSEGASEAFNVYQKKWHRYLARIKDMKKLNEVVQIFSDAWNYFPHRALSGKSPKQMVEQARQKESALKRPTSKQKQPMPDMIVGDHRMSWDDYWAMIAEMERRQEPFKRWKDDVVLPKYKRFLASSLAPKTVDRHYQVADIFFDRVLHVGFLTLDEIRPAFIQSEFPHWWQTHVMFGSWSEQAIRSSLGKLFSFLDLVYGIDGEKFGFV